MELGRLDHGIALVLGVDRQIVGDVVQDRRFVEQEELRLDRGVMHVQDDPFVRHLLEAGHDVHVPSRRGSGSRGSTK